MFSIVLYCLLASLVVKALASLALRRFAGRPRWVGWLYTVATAGVWLFAFAGILLISIVVASLVVVVVALCLLVLAAERRRQRRARPPGRT